MITDALLQLSGTISGNTVTGQTVTGTNTSVLSTNTIDLSSGGVPTGQVREIGAGQDVYARIQVMVAASGGTSVEFQTIGADDAALTTNVTVLSSTGAIPIASLTAGARFAINISPRIGSKGQRYVGMRYVLVGAVAAGAYFADLGLEIADGQKYYPSGFAIL